MEVNFSNELKTLRLTKGLTQKQLGAVFNVHQTTIRDWERRGTEPSFQMLAEIAKYFDVTVGQLLGVED